MKHFLASIGAFFLTMIALPASGQHTSVGLPVIGKVAPRAASEIEASNWSVGAETMDRDYTIYSHWKDYLGPLGIKKARVQAGWAKTEQKPGQYEWAWLDEIIHDMHRQGVEPWINVSYGNAIYAEGGGTLLGAKIPATPEALEGWDRWVRTMVERYDEYVDEWEVWNEPNHGKNPAGVYADLLLRTAKVIRSVQPEARILAIAAAGVDPEYADSVLAVAKQRGELGLIDEITYHPYSRNPDASYRQVEELRRIVDSYDPRLRIRQGENGAPSEWRRTKALSNYNWTALSQAKWALRRLLGDLGRDIPSSYFSLVDMKYPDEMNRKGLLYVNEDKQVLKAKPAYYALQNLASVFDNTLERIPDYSYTIDSLAAQPISLFGYEHTETGQQVVTLWFDGEIPSDSYVRVPVDFEFADGKFSDPVYVDLREGIVYEVPENRWRRTGSSYRFEDVPVYDAPVLIADRSLIPIAE